MKKITQKEFEAHAKGRNHPIIKACLELKVGEGLEILFDEWKLRAYPNTYLSRYKKEGYYFKTRTLNGDKMWLVLRKK